MAWDVGEFAAVVAGARLRAAQMQRHRAIDAELLLWVQKPCRCIDLQTHKCTAMHPNSFTGVGRETL